MAKNNWIKCVEEFEAVSVGKQNLPTELQTIAQNYAILRQSLLQEEVNELAVAMKENNMVEVADAIADCLYILIGTAIGCGLRDKIDLVFKEVHRSNMSKTVKSSSDGKPRFLYNVHGKIMKPIGYQPPNIKSILYGE